MKNNCFYVKNKFVMKKYKIDINKILHIQEISDLFKLITENTT